MIKIKKIIKEIKSFIECPNCDILIELNQMINEEPESKVSCKSCGTFMSVSFQSDENVKLYIHEEKIVPVFILLKSVINKQQRYFVLKRYAKKSSVPETCDIVFEDETDFLHSHQFLYNFGCPVSLYLGSVVCIFDESETEPYNLFEFVAAKAANINESDEDFEKKLKAVFSEELNELLIGQTMFFD